MQDTIIRWRYVRHRICSEISSLLGGQSISQFYDSVHNKGEGRVVSRGVCHGKRATDLFRNLKLPYCWTILLIWSSPPLFLLILGGIRGVVLTRILLSLEKFLPPHPISSIVQCFDWMVGTSTGGILALALASGKSVLESQRIYLRLKERVFNAPTMPYDVHEMTNLLRAEFGDATMADISRHPK